ncbi:MAG TPA: phosphatidylserine/phosphatidylglycerophosphate/cardiolipin synthase family protein [Ktedonobacterales bacterium]|nr:phosphatidylserine/phosphatidylglycerophosphate/cardiolipin synthase family protein [Ktedonobacterales bacterium]
MTHPTSTAASVETVADPWWTEGDFPVRQGVVGHALIDGRAAMLAMCRAFLSAKSSILLAAWDIRADLLMVRGEDAHVGEDGSAEQSALIEGLRKEGLSEEAIALWNANRLQVRDVLGFAVQRGVKVGVLLWESVNLGLHLTNNPPEQQKLLSEVGVDCLLDNSAIKITHLTEALHQKCAVVDGRVAFVGGIDLTLQANGDYDRWDTHYHPAESPDRGSAHTASMHPWHDAHMRLEGPVVADVQRNIVQRWMEVAANRDGPTWPADLPAEPPTPVAGGASAQLIRSIPKGTYDFAPEGIKTIEQAYMRAVSAAQRFIYLESQYLWPEVYRGIDNLLWGGRSEELEAFIDALGDAINRGVSVAIVVPDHPNCGRRFTDAGFERLRERIATADAAERLLMLTLGADSLTPEAPNGLFYRPVYVHAKVGIVDDHWLTIGSANLNNRGFGADAEINISLADPRVAEELRVALWMEHLQASLEEAEDLRSVDAGFTALREQAEANLTRVMNRQPMQGHALPYLTVAQGEQRGISIDPNHGWIDCLEGGVGPTPEAYRDRYI